jgi:hypothetical protein
MVSPEIRSKIIAGKDINLNILLLPNYEIPSKQTNKEMYYRLLRKGETISTPEKTAAG